MTTKRMISISFYGLPGAGKSTIAAELRQHLISNGWAVEDPRARRSLLRKLRSALIHRRFVQQMISSLNASPRSLREKLAAARLTLSALERVVTHKRISGNDSVLVLDESMAQRLFTLLVEADGARWQHLDRLVKTMPMTNVLVRVRADRELIHQRLEERERGIPRRFDMSPDLDRILDEAESMFDETARLLDRRTQVIEIRSPNIAAAELISKSLQRL